MLYTSGTTGRRKGVWCGVFSEDLARGWAEDEWDLWAPEPPAPFLVCSPLFQSAAYRSATAAITAGAPVLLLDRFDAETVVRTMATEPVSGTFFVPTHLRRIHALGEVPSPRSAKRVLHAGEPCPEPLKRWAMQWLPDVLWEFYGSTEGQFTAISPAEWLERPGSVGRARRGRRLEIVDADGDGVGKVYVSAPAFGRWEYWRDRGRTAEAWRGDSFTVGDLGRLDDAGYLYLVARREDLIISGGVNVYPAEVERVLLDHARVEDAAVFGVSDPEWGERVCAAVTGSATEEELRAWATAHLEGPKRPKSFLVLDAFPRTASGKVRRDELRRLVLDA
jgi:acyl-CoA synthetase (AMP-forming)/AMP-acid ligase II